MHYPQKSKYQLLKKSCQTEAKFRARFDLLPHVTIFTIIISQSTKAKTCYFSDVIAAPEHVVSVVRHPEEDVVGD